MILVLLSTAKVTALLQHSDITHIHFEHNQSEPQYEPLIVDFQTGIECTFDLRRYGELIRLNRSVSNAI